MRSRGHYSEDGHYAYRKWKNERLAAYREAAAERGVTVLLRIGGVGILASQPQLIEKREETKWASCDSCKENFHPAATRMEDGQMIAQCPECRQWVEI